MVYVGQTRAKKLIDALSVMRFGEITQPYEFPPRRLPWALDNGAFAAHKAGKPFDEAAFRTVLDRITTAPDFVVCPDIVGGGLNSLALSLAWEERLRHTGYPLALVVQDGMTAADVRPVIERFALLFVGGSLSWKLKTGAMWCRVAKEYGKPCHIGRVGTAKRVAWARRIGAASIDSCLPLWSRDNLDRFVRALAGAQIELDL